MIISACSTSFPHSRRHRMSATTRRFSPRPQHLTPIRCQRSLLCFAFTSSAQPSKSSKNGEAAAEAPTVLLKAPRRPAVSDTSIQPSNRLHKQHEDPQEQQHLPPQGHQTPQEASKPELPMRVQMSIYIKDQWRAAASSMKTNAPAGILSLYCTRMDSLVSSSERHIDHKHIVAIAHGTSQVCTAAESCHKGWSRPATLDLELHALLTRLITKLQQLLPRFDARAASSLLHSFAKLKLNPDALVSGTVDSLAQQLIKDLGSAAGHSYASVLIACVDLRLNPSKGQMLPALLACLSSADMSSFVPQDVTNIAYSLARLPSAKPSPQLLDALCDRLCQQLQSDKLQPNPQDVSLFAWSLQQFKHVPSPMVAAAMLSSMIGFCHEWQGLKPQQISNFLLAYADLRLAISAEEVDLLITHLMQRPKLNAQDLTNTAWAAAVMGFLKPNTFRQILHSMRSVSADMAAPNLANMQQMYQSWNWLEACADPQLKRSKPWLQMQASLQQVGHRPPAVRSRALGPTELLSAALAELGVQHAMGSHTKSYAIDAVVHPPGRPSPILICWTIPDCFTNQPLRLTGRAIFWRKLISKEGTLLELPLDTVEFNPTQLAAYLKPRLEANATDSVHHLPYA